MRSLMILLALATTAHAGPRRVCGPSGNVKFVPVDQQPVQVVPVAPVAFVLASTSQPSSYGAAQYSPPLRDRARSQASSAVSSDKLDLLVAAIEKLVGRVDALEGNLGAPGGNPPVPQIVRQQCGKCHEGSGGESGVTFADIAGVKNDRAQLEVIKGTMPKRGDEAEPIPPEIRQALVAALEEMRR